MSLKVVKDGDDSPLTEQQKQEIFEARLAAASPKLFWLYQAGVAVLTLLIVAAIFLIMKYAVR